MLPDTVPEFNPVDTFYNRPFDTVEIEFPFRLEPMVSFASKLYYKVHDKKEFDKAVSKKNQYLPKRCVFR